MSPPDLSCTYQTRAEFCDLDPMDVVWHGHYVRYLEAARATLLEKFNYSYPQMRESGYGWPIIDLHLKYVAPVVYSQSITVHSRITEWAHRLRIDYRITDTLTQKKLTTGHTIQVAVHMDSREMCMVCPPILWERLGVPPP